ncbi:hypothetical protein T190_29340 [Sinorhizobium meliloti CCBAU 01290]|nr:hypothetical protein T190_29340 [Sinorhizobium meliloti CCBAU 01290]
MGPPADPDRLLLAVGARLPALRGGGNGHADRRLAPDHELRPARPWGALYAYTPELYPTASRATGMGAAGAMARLGGLLAPSLMGLVVAQSFGLAIGIFAGLLLGLPMRPF